MSEEELRISEAKHALYNGYTKVIEHLSNVYQGIASDIIENAQNYEGITPDDVYVWFAESF